MRGLQVKIAAIRELRQANGFTQDDLASEAGCDVRTVRNAEGGNRLDSATLTSIAAVLGASLEDVAHVALANSDKVERNKQVVLEWLEAFGLMDVDRLVSLHHPDSLLELPGTEGMPAGGTFRGVDQLRRHFHELFAVFQLREVHESQLDAIDNLVFHRAESTFETMPTSLKHTTKFYNEFEFSYGLIVRRTTISDLKGHRETLEPV